VGNANEVDPLMDAEQQLLLLTSSLLVFQLFVTGSSRNFWVLGVFGDHFVASVCRLIMCIINKSVEEVSCTKILLALLKDSDANQYCLNLYGNQIKLNPKYTKNAMILAVPAEGKSIELIDASKWAEKCLQNLDKAVYPVPLSRSRGIELPSRSASLLKVEKVGSYFASIAHNLDDLNRVDPEYFTLDHRIAEELQKHYPSGFSFLVMRLDESKAYHPFAYLYPQGKDKLFIPTRHVHLPDDEKSPPTDADTADDWDHHIYVLGYGEKEFQVSDKAVRISGSSADAQAQKSAPTYLAQAIDSIQADPALVGKKVAQPFCLGYKINGKHKNGDFVALN
jgi:hypothetical protein